MTTDYSPRTRMLAARLVADTFADRHNLGKNQTEMLRAYVEYHGTGRSWVFSSKPSFNRRIQDSLVKKGVLVRIYRPTWVKHEPTPEALELFAKYLKHYAKEDN